MSHLRTIPLPPSWFTAGQGLTTVAGMAAKDQTTLIVGSVDYISGSGGDFSRKVTKFTKRYLFCFEMIVQIAFLRCHLRGKSCFWHICTRYVWIRPYIYAKNIIFHCFENIFFYYRNMLVCS